MPTNTHPPIINIPPMGVMGPNIFFGPMSKHKRYILPENIAVPKAIIWPPEYDEGLDFKLL
jgi:hypothetical protein